MTLFPRWAHKWNRTRAVVKALGARRILAIDFQSQCSEFAKRYAATDIHLATLKEGGKMVAYSKCHVSHCAIHSARHVSNSVQGKHTLEHFGFGERSEGIDCVIECSRAEVCVQTCIWIVKRGGT